MDMQEAIESSSVVTAPAQPESEDEREWKRAEVIFRPIVLEAGERARRLRTLDRRYGDACAGKTTVRTRSGEVDGRGYEVGSGHGRATGYGEVRDRRGRQVGSADWEENTTIRWSGSSSWNERWSEVTQSDNASTPECRLIASDMRALSEEIGSLMLVAEQEAYRQRVWTRFITDVPDKLVRELW
jgi:hypothetical protein